MNAVKHLLYTLCCCLVVMQSCVKDPQDIPGGLIHDPAFGMQALLDGQLIMIDAGIDGWTMLPVTDNTGELTRYNAVLSQNGCISACTPAWHFRFYSRNDTLSTPGMTFLNSLYTGEKSWVSSSLERDSFYISLATHPGLFMNGFNYWQDNNNSSTTFEHAYESTVGYQQDINVCFQSLAFTGCQYRQCITFDPATSVPCLTYIDAVLETPRHLVLYARPQGTGPFQIDWFNETIGSNVVIPIFDSSAVVYAGLKVTDARGNTTELTQTIRVRNGIVDACYFPISMSSTLIENNAPHWFADKMEIAYIDPQGHVWRTIDGIQEQDASLSITEVIAYEQSLFPNKVYKVSLQAKVRLFNAESGQSRVLEITHLRLPLSHP